MMDVYLSALLQQLRTPLCLGVAAASTVFGYWLHYYRTRRKKRIASYDMANESGAFLVVVGYQQVTGRPIEAYVIRKEVHDSVCKELAELRRRAAEAQKGHEAKLKAISKITEEDT